MYRVTLTSPVYFVVCTLCGGGKSMKWAGRVPKLLALVTVPCGVTYPLPQLLPQQLSSNFATLPHK